jgi:hypothetical protein
MIDFVTYGAHCDEVALNRSFALSSRTWSAQ